MGRGDQRHRFLSGSSVSVSESRSRSRSRSRSPYDKSSHKRRKELRRKSPEKRRSRKESPRRKERSHRNRSSSKSRSEGSDRRRSRRERDRRSNKENDERYTRERRHDKQDVNNQAEEEAEKPEEPHIEPEKPCFIPSGILAKFTNTVNGVVLKFTEPPDAAVPKEIWKIYPFKGDEALPALHLHRQSCYLIGKDPKVADILVENPTCSSQHAVIQFREVKKTIGDEVIAEIRPYILDLESKNGTFLNGEKLEPARYYQLLPKDVIKLANSTRDYVIMRG